MYDALNMCTAVNEAMVAKRRPYRHVPTWVADQRVQKVSKSVKNCGNDCMGP